MDAAALLAAIVESSEDAIVGKSLDGTVLSWNDGAQRIFGYTAEEMIGASIRKLVPADREDEEDRILASITRGERVPHFETIRQRKDGSQVKVSVTVSPVRDADGRIVAASKIARDISEQVRIQDRLMQSEERFRLMADNIAQLAWIADSSGWVFWYNQRWYDYTGTSLEQMQGWGWTHVQHSDHLDRVAQRWKDALAAGEVWEDTFPLRGGDGEYRWFLSRALPMRDAAGQVQCWFGTNTDITERLDAQRRIELLMMEVNHRSKNLLALVQSLARRTVPGDAEFIDRLEARIAGLSANQDLLVERSWASVPVCEMVDAQLAFLDGHRPQVHSQGPDVSVSPSAAEAIGMALHELATNALKYGALSCEEGKVAIDWSLETRDGALPSFRMTWRESGGPTVTPPVKDGFGTRIILDVPRGKLRCEVDIEYAPEGLVWKLDCPADNVIA